MKKKISVIIAALCSLIMLTSCGGNAQALNMPTNSPTASIVQTSSTTTTSSSTNDIEVNQVTMYAPDGRTIQVNKSEVEAYKNVGWYTEPVCTVYAPDGRTSLIYTYEKAAYLSVGWYAEPVCTVYAPDGRTSLIYTYEKAAYLSVGWYAEPVCTVYAPDGRTSLIFKSELQAYLNVGWYATASQAQSAAAPTYATTSSSNARSNSTYVDNKSEVVYITRTGHKYHRAGCRYLSRSCIEISLREAIAEGYTACSVCM